MAAGFASRLLKWFDVHGRKDLPWQQPRSAYRVWVSEVMLQQTQVKTVIPYFENFMGRFPDLPALARASEDDVLHAWSGLGYYSRGRNLRQAAIQVMQENGGDMPREIEQLMALPGIGRSTAAAILAQAHELPHAILDGNVKRVLCRYHGIEGWPGQTSVQAQLWHKAEQHTPKKRVADYTQAIMDLGASVCSRSKPACDVCPLRSDCVARRDGWQQDLPTRKPKKSLPVKAARLLVLLDEHDQVLLEKRPPTGIWAGLWSLPECLLEDDIEQVCRQRFQLSIRSASDKTPLRHSFSHYHLDITPCKVCLKNPHQCVMEDNRLVWYNGSPDTRLGLAAPVRSIIERMHEE